MILLANYLRKGAVIMDMDANEQSIILDRVQARMTDALKEEGGLESLLVLIAEELERQYLLINMDGMSGQKDS